MREKMRFEEKLNKANKLRMQSSQKMRVLEKVSKDWEKKAGKAKDAKECEAVNKKFQEMYNLADKADSKAYKEYYTFVNKNFDRTAVMNAAADGKFLNKVFIDRLAKTQKSVRKAPAKRTVAIKKTFKRR